MTTELWRGRLFPLSAGGLWVVFLFLDIMNRGDSTWIKFTAICLCCATALLETKTIDGKLVAAALCLTVGADWFLLVRDRHYLLGIWLFIVVQVLYALRIFLRWGRPHSPLLWVRAALLLLCLCAAPVLGPLSPVLFYFCNLCINTTEAFTLGRPLRIFAVGLLLFVCCDICVGLWNVGLFPSFTRVGMWLFYLPSQVLIVLSQDLEKGDLNEKDI